MSRSRHPTVQQQPKLSVVVIGGGLALIGAVRQAVANLTTADVIPVDVNKSTNTVAERRPFALIVSQELYEFDADEFAALARDVQSRLIVAPTGASEARLMNLLVPELAEALRFAFG